MVPVLITFRDLPSTPTLESHIRKKADKLNQFYNRITQCRVVIEVPQKHKHTGKIYNVRIDVTVPGKEFLATRKYHEDLYVAIRESFSAIMRQLEEHSHKVHGQVKTHELLEHGRVERIIPEEGYGFISGSDGNEYYFSVTNCSNGDFQKLLPGDYVQFIPTPFNDGWQAHRVKVRENHQAA